MFDALRATVLKRIDLSDEEFAQAASFFKQRKIRRRYFLLHEGDVCTSLAFVNKGCLRSCLRDAEGTDHTVQFAIEDWWISDSLSFFTGEPSKYTIEALEDSELLILDPRSYDQLFENIPKFERFFRKLLERRLMTTQRRIAESLSMSAQERYLSFIRAYPALAQRVPQAYIASFIGITPESLSRVRKNLESGP